MEIEEVKIRGPVILLQAVLKLLGYVSMGGEIKSFLADTTIEVNGEPEARRGRKLRHGDVVLLPNEKKVRIVADLAD